MTWLLLLVLLGISLACAFYGTSLLMWSAAMAGGLLAVSLIYFHLCRKFGMAMEWVFLTGLLLALVSPVFALMKIVNFSYADAVAYATITHFINYLVPLILGGYYLIANNLSPKELLRARPEEAGEGTATQRD